jgi:hypothetical protein
MAVCIIIDIEGGTQEQYDAVLARLGLTDEQAVWPPGIISHVAGPFEGGWRMVDVWESEEAFERFFWAPMWAPEQGAQDILGRAMQEAGLRGVQTRVFPIHNHRYLG